MSAVVYCIYNCQGGSVRLKPPSPPPPPPSLSPCRCAWKDYSLTSVCFQCWLVYNLISDYPVISYQLFLVYHRRYNKIINCNMLYLMFCRPTFPHAATFAGETHAPFPPRRPSSSAGSASSVNSGPRIMSPTSDRYEFHSEYKVCRISLSDYSVYLSWFVLAIFLVIQDGWFIRPAYTL